MSKPVHVPRTATRRFLTSWEKLHKRYASKYFQNNIIDWNNFILSAISTDIMYLLCIGVNYNLTSNKFWNMCKVFHLLLKCFSFGSSTFIFHQSTIDTVIGIKRSSRDNRSCIWEQRSFHMTAVTGYRWSRSNLLTEIQ